MIEEWRLIHIALSTHGNVNKGDKYYISNYGRCKINDKLICNIQKSGYVKFYDKLVHRLVYETFIGSIPDGLEIDHIDGDRTNNHVNNLRLVSHKENCNNPITLSRNKGWLNMGKEKMNNQHKHLSSLRIGSKLVIGEDGKRHWKYF